MVLTFGARLVALKMTITLSVCLVLCILLYAGVRYALFSDIDGFLASEILELQGKLEEPDSTLASTERRIRRETGVRRRGDFSVRVLDTKGAVLISSRGPDSTQQPWKVPQRLPDADQSLLRNEQDSRGNIRTCSRWIELSDGTPCIAQVSYRLDDLQNTLTRFLQFCGISLLAAAFLTIVGGRVLSRQVLLPISEMAAAARKIGVENLSGRLALRGSGDELDDLSRTFNDMFQRLESQVEQLRQFTADAAHELRTPLAALRGTAEVALSQNRPQEELRTALIDSIDEYDRLSRIADDLLLLARADAGQLLIRQSPVELVRAAKDVIDLFSPVAEEAGIQLNCSSSGQISIVGDDGRIRQMIGNILDNAIKYTLKGGQVSVDLAVDRTEAVLTTRDTGVGISVEDIPRVFDRFFRADRARTRERGTGLGLAICQTIVRAHKGSIRLESALGRGTTVTIRFPLLTVLESIDSGLRG